MLGSDLFDIGEPQAPEPKPVAGEIARGDYWSIRREGDEYLLYHLSGDMLGREKRLALTEREARSIISGALDVAHFLPPNSGADQSRSLPTNSVKLDAIGSGPQSTLQNTTGGLS